MRRWLLVLVLVLVACSLQPVCGAALVHGTIYQWDTLEPLPDVVIEVNTTPHQMVVSKTGTYSLLLENGTYGMEFSYIVDGIPTLGASETIAVSSKGDYVLDVLLFPLNESMPEFSEMSENSEDGFAWIPLPIAALLLCLMLYAAYAKGWLSVRRAPLKKSVHQDDTLDTLGEGLSSLPDDMTQALEIIEQAGGRITQKELRKKLGGSEAKVSLLISELVHRGLVEKVKAGRGNVVYLKR
ncbi:MAG: helix-turn-helix transcriptional regulator [Methermicoccaceae archaeon]